MQYKDGFPADNGATDFMDSARLAGILVLFNHPSFDKALIHHYVIRDEEGNKVGVRHPTEYPANNYKNFTRDQMMCLVAGLKAAGKEDFAWSFLDRALTHNYRAQNTEADIPGSIKKFPNGPDLLGPSHMNHLRMCANKPPKLLGLIWLAIVDILFNAIFTPMAEPNQLMCMCKIAGPRWVKFMRFTNRKLDKAIRNYWGYWRGEPELAEFLINSFK